MNRPLGAMERALSLTDAFAPLTVVAVARLAGAPGPENVRDALARLQARHPLLGARISPPPRRFVPGTHPVPLQLLPRRDDHHWREVVEHELNTRVAAERGPPLRCSYLWGAASGSDRVELALTFHHAVVDGVSAAHALADLLADLGGDAGNDAGPNPSAPPSDELLPPAAGTLSRRFGYVGRELRAELSAALLRRDRSPVHRSGRNGLLSDALDSDTSSALARRSRRARLGLASVLHAAMMLALQRQRGGGPDTMTGVYFADLRPYLRPPVPERVLGSYIAMLRLRAQVPASGDRLGDLWTLANSLQARTLEAGRRGDKFAAALTTNQFMRLALATRARRLGATALSYAGPVKLAACHGSVRIEALHGFVSNNPLGPVFTAQGRIFDGRLRLDVVHLHEDLDRAAARLLLDDTLALLAKAAKP